MAKKKAAKKATKKETSTKSAKNASNERDASKMFRNTDYAVLGDMMEMIYFNNDGNATLADVKAELEDVLDALEGIIDEYGGEMSLDDYNDAAEAKDAAASSRDEAVRKKSMKKR